MIAINDYGVGNLFSLRSSLGALGFATEATGDANTISKRTKYPAGVGAFGAA